MPDPKIPQLPGPPIPIIGESGKQYMIGGVALGFSIDPDQLVVAFKQEIANGTTLPHLFMMQWQRTAMHFGYHDERIQKVEKALATAEKRIKRLESQLDGSAQKAAN